MRRFRPWLLALCSASALAAPAEPVVVMTSYPEEVMSRFEDAFSQAHPQWRVQILWRQGYDALPWLRQPEQGGVDVYWAPSPGNFERLAAEHAWQPLGVDLRGLPARIGATPLRDAQARYQATELAGYGFASNPQRLRELGVATPKDWLELLDPRLREHIALPDPARVGYAPVLLDIVLQAYGWERGWALWSELAGRARLVSRGGSLVSDEVASGRSALGLSIDFFVASAISNGQPVRFTYPRHGGLNPAHIAISAGAKHPDGARAFVRFVLSDAGQQLLADPEIRKLPVRPEVYRSLPAHYPNPFRGAQRGDFAYRNSSAERLALVTSLFVQWPGQPHERLNALWQRIHAGEAAGHDLSAVRACLNQPPLSASAAEAPALLALFATRPSAGMGNVPASEQEPLGQQEIAWQFYSAQRQAEAQRLLEAMGL
ncbi:ABC transporter substrate-binding protein [Pseudomonas cremoricolorata]|nr:extracellular solute-binding protein [Pseudomonas cremoricolorata]